MDGGINIAFMTLPDAAIYYESTGGGKPPLVFIHGFTCDHTDWHFQVKRLSSTNRVVTCDLRGHGRSTGGKPGVTIEDQARDMGNLLNTLKIRDAILIGHSMGCRVCLETGRQNPGLVAGIVFVDGSQRGKGDPTEAVASIKKAAEGGGYPAYMRNTFAGMFFGKYDVSFKNRIIERALALNPDFGISLRSNFAGWDAAKMEPALSELKVPLFLIQSTGINASNERYSLKKGDTNPWLETVRRLVPSVRIEILPGYGHFNMLEAPDAVSELIASFVVQFRKD
jgi:pimeloyl-ACP methyl ester carboxylesterase